MIVQAPSRTADEYDPGRRRQRRSRRQRLNLELCNTAAASSALDFGPLRLLIQPAFDRLGRTALRASGRTLRITMIDVASLVLSCIARLSQAQTVLIEAGTLTGLVLPVRVLAGTAPVGSSDRRFGSAFLPRAAAARDRRAGQAVQRRRASSRSPCCSFSNQSSFTSIVAAARQTPSLAPTGDPLLALSPGDSPPA